MTTEKLLKAEAWKRLRDNEHVKRALEVALAGGHSVMVIGREGDGKELLDVIMGTQVRFIEPCPCGNHGQRNSPCACTASRIIRYRSTLRFRRALDAAIRVEIFPPRALTPYDAEPFTTVMQRVTQARQLRDKAPRLDIEDAATELYQAAHNRLALTEKQQDAIQRIAMTVARLDDSRTVKAQHMAEAIQYQTLK